MTNDPWTILPDISCPTCHVMGKIVVNSDDDEAYEGSESPSMCVECGQCFVDAGMLGDVSLKEARRHYMRRLEGMPYEPPKPKEPARTRIADDATFHGPIRMPWPSHTGPIAEGNTDGTYRVTKVCQATGTIIVERETAMPTEKRDALLATTWAMPDDAMAVPQISKTPQTGVYAGALPRGAELQSVAVDPATGDVTIRYTKK